MHIISNNTLTAGIAAIMALSALPAFPQTSGLTSIDIASDYQNIFNVRPLQEAGDTVWINSPARYTKGGVTLIFPYTTDPSEPDSKTRVYLENNADEGVVLNVYEAAKVNIEVAEGYGIPYMEINGLNPVQNNASNPLAPSSGTLAFMEKGSDSWWRSWKDNAAPSFVTIKGNSSTWFKGFYVKRVDMEEYVPVPSLSMPSGNVSGSFSLSMSFDISAPEGSVIYYTLDGSDPMDSETSILYTAPIEISTTTEVKARGYNEEYDYWSEPAEARYTFPTVASDFMYIFENCEPKAEVALEGTFSVVANYIYSSTSSSKVNNLVLRDAAGNIGVLKLPKEYPGADSEIRNIAAGETITGSIRGVYTVIQNRHVQIQASADPAITVTSGELPVPEEITTDDIKTYLSDLGNDGKLVRFTMQRDETPLPVNYYTSLYSTDVKINPWTKGASQYLGRVELTGIVFPQIDSKGTVKPQIILWGEEDCAKAILDYDRQSWYKNSSGATGTCRIILNRPARAGEWTAISMPFKWTYEELQRIYGSESIVAQFPRNSNQGAGNTVKFDVIESPSGDIPISTPLLVKPSVDVTGPVEVTALAMNGTGTATVLGGSSATSSDVVFTSLINPIGPASSFNPGSSYSHLTKWITLDNGMFRHVYPEETLDGMNALILVRPGTLDETGNIKIQIGDEGLQTGIATIHAEENVTGEYYDLSGRNMGSDPSVLLPGIYIRDRKKVTIGN